MANPFPLQPGDRSKDLSGRDASDAGDRREFSENSVQSYAGGNRAPESGSPEYPIYKVGALAPVRHMAPFETVEMQGDTSGTGTDIYEVDIYKYGDCYDPTAPTRVRTAPWGMDTDFDGEKN